MRIKNAARILNVSHATVHNWIKSGKLKLNKVLPNGYRDIDEESVYEAVASTYEPDSGKNRIIIFRSDGSMLKFDPSDKIVDRIVEYLVISRDV